MRLPPRALPAWLAVTVTTFLVVCGTGCSAADSADAHVERTPGRSAPPSDGSVPAGDDARVRYASCLRDNGVQVTDPKPGEAVVLPTGLPQSLLDRVKKACGKNPTGQALKAEVPDGLFTDAQFQALQLKFNSCMRKNGYDAPKPDAHGNVAIQDTPHLRTAMKACHAENEALNDRIKALTEKGRQ